ncbi:Hpt domain-containing protein [Arenimonas fontis]|uniref:Chemotaxis protein CheA n=1 Tax=Arenimonas fontis TaxID=2608255 RepID=A0A5B2ZB11_9GAMM|nr:Hpt domain-containing protein [Arenimonas fontis]KAA2285157.1 response regulator [Arenimonas fontis]
MRLNEDIDFTTLTWVKPELDETLRQARQALEAYVEEGEDPGQLKACATFLHQVQGTLRMVELYGAAMVAEEMEQLAKALVDGQVADREAGYAALMRGIVQLPDYLERLQSGHRDIPIVLLPLLNELREVRGEKGLSEAVLFSPDLSRPLPPSAAGPAEPLPPEQLRRRAETLRGLFQSALLRWLKDDNSANTIRDLTDVCEQLVPITGAEHARRLFWVAAGTLDALAKGAFEAGKPLKQALAKVEREIKRLAEGGDAAFRSEPPLELTRQLLYYVAHAPTDHGRIGEIRAVFGLGDYLPSESELAHARGSLTGRNRALLSTVAAAIKEDLLRVKDALDLHLRTPEAAAASLSDQVEALDRVADTLGMLGLGMPRRVVQDQRNAIHAIVSGQKQADEASLLDIAGALLYVEASLDDQVSRLGEAETEAEPGAGATTAAEPMLPGSEARKVLEVLVKEAIANFAQARQCFVAFVETHWDHAQLNDVPRLLEEVAGALRILEMQEAPEYLTAVRRFTENELLRRHRVPNGQQMDRLADALAGLEYFLEAVRDRRPRREQILEVARQNLEALGYWPLPPEEALPASPAAAIPSAGAATAAVPAPAAPAEPAPAEAGEADARAPEPAPAAEAMPDLGIPLDAEVLQALPEAGPQVAEPAEPAAAGSQPVDEVVSASAGTDAPAPVPGLPAIPGFDGGSDIDDEIRDVFLEEFQEEIGNLEQLLPAWRTRPEDLERLRPIRRVFHTLKGSGRLVGAKTLGEFSWKVENMLNRVLDGTRPASPAVVGLIEHAFNTLPLLRAALQGETVYADLAGIEAVADRIAAGEEADYQPPVAASGAAVPVVSRAETEVESPAALEPVAAPADAAPAPPAEARTEASVAEPAEGDVDFAIDPVLFEILKPEVAGHLETLDAWLASCIPEPQPVTDPLLRAVHTMNGAFAMTEVTVLSEVTAPLEGFIKRSLAARRPPGDAGVAVVREAADAIREAIAALEQRAPLASYADLAARIAALRDSLPEPTAPVMPVAPEEPAEPEVMPTPVILEAPDLSALPVFEDDSAGTGMDLPAASAEEPSSFAPADGELPDEAMLDLSGDGPGEQKEAAGEMPADQPEPEHLSLEAFLQEEPEEPAFSLSGTEEAGVSADEMAAAEAAMQAAAAEAAAAEAAAAEAAAAEAAAAEAAAAEAAAAEAAAAEAAAAEAAAAEAAAAEAAAAEAAAAKAAAAEAAAAEAAAAEAAAAEAAAAAAAAEAAAAEAAAAEAAAAEAAAAEAAAAEAAAAEAAAAEAAAAEAEEADLGLEESLPAMADDAQDPADPDAPLDTADIDEDLLDIFLEESADLLDHSDGLLAGLRDAPADLERIVALQRDLHTLKGGARMAGIFAVGELGHAMESLLEAVAEGRRQLDPTGVSVLEHAFDRLHGMVTRVGQRRAIGLPARLIARIDALAKGQPLDSIPEPAVPAPATGPAKAAEKPAEPRPVPAAPSVETPVVRPVPSTTGLTPLSAPIEDLGEEEEGAGVRAPQEQVRIRADLLDRLVNYAGEVAIYRARLEQQLGAFRGNLGELGQLTTRLREQVRKLDIETEAQIIARYQREGEQGNEEFDPLELDRFTTQQQLSRSLAESAADLASLQGSLEDLVRQYETLLLQQSRVSSDLQEGLMRTRMVPFDALVPRLRRVLRQAGSETRKQVNLKVDGASGEMDRNVLDRMTAPLEHMLRNAVAHGLEAPAERRKAGKPEEGTVRIQVLREGSEVVLRISDDGRGLDKEAIRRKAIERGLLKAGAEVTDQTLYGYILESGFSTAASVSRLAGRGVGMDVVYAEIRQLGGTLGIESQAGKGTVFTIRLPFTLAVTQAVFVKIGDTSFAVPIASVQGVGRIGRAELEKQLAGENPSFTYAGESYAIHDLGRLIGHAPAKAQDSLQMPLLLARSGDLRAAICVDQVLGSREIVVKPVGPQVNSIPGIFGATIMGDGRVVVILDVAPLVRRQASLEREKAEAAPVAAPAARRVPVVMVVDDSITMRKVTGRVLERHNFEVMTAKDGVDAIEKMAERIPDLMLLDIEMPRMDGYELAQNMRSDARLKDVPIIMITSRTGEKHRQRAFDIGVNRYLGKPYQEVELMRNVFEMLGMEPVNG